MSDQRETVLITGASSGIGEALAWVFAEYHYDLVLVARSADKLDELADDIAERYDVVVSVRPMDLSEPGSAESLAKVLHREDQQIDILVNNAGVLEHGAFVELSPQDHQRMVQLNVAGFTDMLAHFVPDMVARGSGRILNVSSIAAYTPVPSLATYAATKAYILSLSEALAEELQSAGISVTAACPGFTDTHMIQVAKSRSVGLRKLPSMLVGDAETVAREAFHGCIKGVPIVVPGSLNLATTLTSRATPKWLVRKLSGVMGRSTL